MQERVNILEQIKDPLDVKRLTEAQRITLCGELRSEIVSVVAKNGGHLASNLGAVELTVALHACFEPPIDRLVFDVGHQCYAHKLLTGRRDRFSTLRRFGGLSGFPRPDESPADAFYTGHSSTAISAAGGMATGLRLQGLRGWTVAVVGDGAMTGGLSLEGLNNAAETGRLLIVLNDNGTSISKNVGSLANHLSDITSSPLYFRIKDDTRRAVKSIPGLGQPLYRAVSAGKRIAKDVLTPGNLFENYELDYSGPLDGHDVQAMVDVFRRVRSLARPAVVHVKTVKGKGMAYAERIPRIYHGVGPFDPVTGAIPPARRSFSQVFG
ncbi:MAG: 1-deoxy-D-xylulose-5-phosphate synthase, partial [Clostridia bacterium]|nr:1-deoxy-D-xylulose-5-phosphate synthase [Clostridia bacterium]